MEFLHCFGIVLAARSNISLFPQAQSHVAIFADLKELQNAFSKASFGGFEIDLMDATNRLRMDGCHLSMQNCRMKSVRIRFVLQPQLVSSIKESSRWNLSRSPSSVVYVYETSFGSVD